MMTQSQSAPNTVEGLGDVEEHDCTVPGSSTGQPPSGTPAPMQPPAQRAAKRTGSSALLVAALFAVVLLLLLVFILENSQRVDISRENLRAA